MFNLEFAYPAWYILPCLLAGTGLALLLYFKDKTFSQLTHAKTLNAALTILRAVLLSILFILLLSPLLKIIHSETEKPLIVILKDGSESLPLMLSKENITTYNQSLDALAANLNKDYEVQVLKFGADVSASGLDSFNEKATDISNALTYVYENNRSRNLGAIILSSDGIYNKGSNPLYLPQLSSVPLFTIPVGDTTVKRDVALSKINVNSVVYLGNNFNMQIIGKATACAASTTTLTVSLVADGGEKKLFEKNIVITNNAFTFSQEVTLSASHSGVNHYRVRLSEVENEITALNNVADVFVEVREAKDKILIMADAPHPDIAALILSLQELKNYEPEVRYQPDYPQNINEFKLVVLHQLPSGDNYFIPFFNKLKEKKIPLLFILGNETIVGTFNTIQNAVKLNNSNSNLNNAQPVFNKDFSLFTLSDNTKERLSAFPPLITLFAEYKMSPATIPFLWQKIGNVQTSYPLIAFEQGLQGNTGIISGEGIWRWRLYDYQKNKNHDAFNEIMQKCIQFLISRADSKPFRVYVQNESGNSNTRIFGENEPVFFNAELYNDAAELVNTPDVKLNINDNNGKTFSFLFNKTNNAYTLNSGSFTAGSYQWKATTTFNNRNLTESGSFRVSPVQLESINLTADYNLLYQLAENSGGAMFSLSQTQEILSRLNTSETIKPVIYTVNQSESVINLKWLFAVLLSLLSLEWFLRKYNGGY